MSNDSHLHFFLLFFTFDTSAVGNNIGKSLKWFIFCFIMDVMEWKIEENGTNASTWVQFFFENYFYLCRVTHEALYEKWKKCVWCSISIKKKMSDGFLLLNKLVNHTEKKKNLSKCRMGAEVIHKNVGVWELKTLKQLLM